MPTTPNYSFPYPALSDAPNGPDAFEDLAEAVDTALDAAETAAIQKTIVNAKGDLIASTGSDAVARLPVGTNGQVLAADSGESTGVKWVAPPVGVAAADTAAVSTAESLGSTGSYIDLATAGPAVTVTVGPSGIAIVSVSARIDETAVSQRNAFVSFALSGANTVAAADANALSVSGTGVAGSGSAVVVLTGLTPGSTTFTMKYKGDSTGPTLVFKDRKIGVVTF